MNIERPNVIAGAWDLVDRGGGMLLGLPGAGKSVVMRHLVEDAPTRGLAPLYLPVDSLTVADPEEIPRKYPELAGGSIYGVLDRILEVSGMDRGVLLVDALDAARDEAVRDRYLTFIKSVKSRLPSWVVVVSMRVYDALHSSTVQDCLPGPDAGQRPGVPGVVARHYLVPEFTSDERTEALSQIYGESDAPNFSDGLLEVLRNPFQLWLLEQLGTSAPREELARLPSGVALLQLYWLRRVEGTGRAASRNAAVSRLLVLMRNRRTLAVPEADATEAIGERLEDLSRIGLVRTASPFDATRLVAFSHNVLFDYAVARTHLQLPAVELAAEVASNPEETVFLRPSIQYRVEMLWLDERGSYWEFYSSLRKRNEPSATLIGRTLVPQTASEGTWTSADVEDITSPLLNEEERGEFCYRYLQSLKRVDLWPDLRAEVIEQLSEDIHSDFAIELVNRIRDVIPLADDDATLPQYARASRNVFGWLLERRHENPGLDRFISHVALEALLATSDVDPAATAELLERAGTAAINGTVAVGLLYGLCHHAHEIAQTSRATTERLYAKVFRRHDLDDAATHMGGYVLALRSNVRQDFDMCRYGLGRSLDELLKTDWRFGLECAFKAVEAYVEDYEHPSDTSLQVSILGHDVEITDDGSYIWDSDSSRDRTNILDPVSKWLAGTTDDSREILELFCTGAKHAVLWRRLLEAGVQNPRLRDLLVGELGIAPLFDNLDLTFPLGNLISASWADLGPEQRQTLEQALLSTDPEGRQDDAARLLAALGVDNLQSADAKALAEQATSSYGPPFSITSGWGGPITAEDMIREGGGDPSALPARSVLSATNWLSDFAREFMNSSPPRETFGQALPKIREAYETTVAAESNLDERTRLEAWTRLADAAEVATKQLEDPEQRALVDTAFLGEVLRKAVETRASWENDDVDFDKHISWSPTPSTEAVHGLWRLYLHCGDKASRDAALQLSKSPYPAVRYMVARWLPSLFQADSDRYWDTLTAMIGAETKPGVFTALTHALAATPAWRDVENKLKLLDAVAAVVRNSQVTGTLPDAVIELLADLMTVKEEASATELVAEVVDDPSNVDARAALARALLRYLEISAVMIPGNLEVALRARAVMQELVRSSGRAITHAIASGDQSELIDKHWQMLDNVVSRAHITTTDERGKVATSEDLARYLELMLPLLQDTLSAVEVDGEPITQARIANDVAELGVRVRAANPRDAVLLVAGFAVAARRTGFSLDSIGASSATEFARVVLADHRSALREPEVLASFLTLLDMFADSGWPDAENLAFNLEQIYR